MAAALAKQLLHPERNGLQRLQPQHAPAISGVFCRCNRSAIRVMLCLNSALLGAESQRVEANIEHFGIPQPAGGSGWRRGQQRQLRRRPATATAQASSLAKPSTGHVSSHLPPCSSGAPPTHTIGLAAF